MLSKLHLPVAHGRLEALIEEPDGARAAAVVCHPHPQHGGTMNNNVAYRLAKGLVRHGVVALRFNFRGVGTSSGTHGGGEDEQEDVIAALDFLQARHPALPLWVTGVSFGARVGLAVGAAEARATRLLGVGLVPRMFDFGFLLTCEKPKALIHGEEDELAEASSIVDLHDRMPQPKKLVVVPGAKHLFPGQLERLDAAVDESIAFLLGA